MTDFRKIQRNFAAHIKNPEQNAHGLQIDERRMQVYRELFFNNIVGFIDNSFPVLASLYERKDWLRLVREFFAQHDCRSPFFVDISKEFVEFLANEYQHSDNDPKFIAELAHYEWLELDVSIRKGHPPKSSAKQLQDNSCLYLSTVASLVSYQYPVHQISPNYQPGSDTEMVYLVVYRNLDEQVEFTLINQVTAYLLQLIDENTHDNVSAHPSGVTLQSLVNLLTDALPQMSHSQLHEATRQIVTEFIDKTVIGIV